MLNEAYISKSRVKEIVSELECYNYKGNLEDSEFIKRKINMLQFLLSKEK